EGENLSKYIQKKDLDELGEALGTHISQICKRYFLSIQDKPKISKGKSSINISISLKKEEE
ncbi:MAG: hypothetical protein Q8M92_10475, partial [Candidatus Subteraquimicrobiales bacterium]|nr:hypothetical protein [Candidatus Subteraquimicrobiales bacterium]